MIKNPLLSFFLYHIINEASTQFTDTLNIGETLTGKGGLTSRQGTYSLVVQNDGYVVLYKIGIQSIWMSPTANQGHGSPYKLKLQPDGDLVFFRNGNTPIWNTKTTGKGGHHLTIQDDGDLVLYNESGTQLWSSGTAGFVPGKYRQRSEKSTDNEQSNDAEMDTSIMNILRFGETLLQGGVLISRNEHYRATIQVDGNFVVYKREKEASSAIWCTNTHQRGSPPYRLAMQLDGNLVVYGSENSILWIQKTKNQKFTGQHLVLQDDGSLVIFDETKKSLWSSMGGSNNYDL